MYSREKSLKQILRARYIVIEVDLTRSGRETNETFLLQASVDQNKMSNLERRVPL